MVLKESGLAPFLLKPNPEDLESSVEKILRVPAEPGSLSCPLSSAGKPRALSEAWFCSLEKKAWEFFQEKHKSEFRSWKVSKEGNSFKIF